MQLCVFVLQQLIGGPATTRYGYWTITASHTSCVSLILWGAKQPTLSPHCVSPTAACASPARRKNCLNAGHCLGGVFNTALNCQGWTLSRGVFNIVLNCHGWTLSRGVFNTALDFLGRTLSRGVFNTAFDFLGRTLSRCVFNTAFDFLGRTLSRGVFNTALNF